MRDPTVWPQKRDLAMFKAWFDAEFCSMTMDVVGGYIETEEEGDKKGSELFIRLRE
jgi:hypothetical protein